VGDGGAKADKYSRDIRLLTEALETEPRNPRYWFYLANSYRDTHHYEKAVECYGKRIEIGGWIEEVYCAMLYKGDTHILLCQPKEAVSVWLDAYQHDPTRSEALGRLATHYRTVGQHQLAMLFTHKGLTIPFPKHRVLFIEKPIYDYKLWYELSISAYYTGDKDMGKKACEKIISIPTTPEFIKESTKKNYLFYV